MAKKLTKKETIEIIKEGNIEGLDTIKSIEEFEKTLIKIQDLFFKAMEVEGSPIEFGNVKYTKKLQEGKPERDEEVRNPKTKETFMKHYEAEDAYEFIKGSTSKITREKLDKVLNK